MNPQSSKERVENVFGMLRLQPTRECATICKLQLKVIIFWNFTDEQNEPAKFKFAFEQKKKKETWAEFLEGVDRKKGTAHCICKLSVCLRVVKCDRIVVSFGYFFSYPVILVGG